MFEIIADLPFLPALSLPAELAAPPGALAANLTSLPSALAGGLTDAAALPSLSPEDVPVPAALSNTFRILDLSGVLLNGILGGLIARRKNFDLVGFIVLAMLTATGGGILRDLLIQAGPPFALTDPYYLYTACAGALIAWWFPFHSPPAQRFLVVADAVVLGTWAATGASKALLNGLGVMPALLLGCMTAVGGSMIRDICVGETPAVFGGNKLYAVPALCSAATEVALVSAGLPPQWAMVAATIVGAGTCLLAYWRSWRLPVSSDVQRLREERKAARAKQRSQGGRTDGMLTGRGSSVDSLSDDALPRGRGGTVRSGWRPALMGQPVPKDETVAGMAAGLGEPGCDEGPQCPGDGGKATGQRPV